jgi:hypothetical protein
MKQPVCPAKVFAEHNQASKEATIMKLPHTLLAFTVLGTMAITGPAFAQVSPQTLKSISIPDKVDTSIGKPLCELKGHRVLISGDAVAYKEGSFEKKEG